MTVICGWLASVCAGLEERGEREREGRRKKKKLRVRERDSRKTEERKEATPVSGLFSDGHEDGWTVRQTAFEFCCAVTSQHLSPFLSCYHNDAELCRLLTSPLGWLEKEAWVLTVFLLIKERWPSNKAESNRRDPSGLSGLGIDLIYTGGFRPRNKECIFFDENEDLLGLWMGCILYRIPICQTLSSMLS